MNDPIETKVTVLRKHAGNGSLPRRRAVGTAALTARVHGNTAAGSRSASEDGLTLFPPLEMVNTAFPVSVPPEAVVRPPKTVSWPPVGNVSVAPSVISTASLAARYETVKFVIGCRIVCVFFLTFLVVTVSSW